MKPNPMFEEEKEAQHSKKSWLEELAGQSWNLELVVSGAAIFSTSFLPEIIESGISSYYQNYLQNDSLINYLLPTLAYGFAKAAAYLLIFTFVIHFICRAFWIAMVGLRAVYPHGIIFENIPNTNASVQETLRKKFGSLDDFIIKLDKRCSLIFSGAFTLVFLSFCMAMVYIIIFFIIVIAKTFYPDFYIFIKYAIIALYCAFMLLSIVISILGSKKQYKELPFVTKSQLLLSKVGSLMFFGMYKPISYIGFTLSSNMTRKKYYMSFLGNMLVFMCLGMLIYIIKLSEFRGLPLMESRNYYLQTSNENKFKSFQYDNLRLEGEEIIDASIQADVVEEPFIKLFINYNKKLDADLFKIYKAPTIPDSLNKEEKRIIKNKAHLASINEYFQLAINDSTFSNPEYFFEEHGALKTKGFKIYVGTENIKAGRNALNVKKLVVDSLPKKVWVNHASIPFWFAKPK